MAGLPGGRNTQEWIFAPSFASTHSSCGGAGRSMPAYCSWLKAVRRWSCPPGGSRASSHGRTMPLCTKTTFPSGPSENSLLAGASLKRVTFPSSETEFR